ncbi:ComEA family DNA-binding protein [Ningiella sp. W23]|uniref:ComEA family DNA-binding protein n=1 Tax=Ningiella sp. W23 TaxID=3023715 RepID=UPI003757644D
MKLKTLLVTCLACASLLSIPAHAASSQSDSSSTNGGPAFTLVNINKADSSALTSLPGIGQKKAEAIVSYRELNGEFQSVEELGNVKGIGKRMVERLATKVTI